MLWSYLQVFECCNSSERLPADHLQLVVAHVPAAKKKISGLKEAKARADIGQLLDSGRQWIHRSWRTDPVCMSRDKGRVFVLLRPPISCQYRCTRDSLPALRMKIPLAKTKGLNTHILNTHILNTWCPNLHCTARAEWLGRMLRDIRQKRTRRS